MSSLSFGESTFFKVIKCMLPDVSPGNPMGNVRVVSYQELAS